MIRILKISAAIVIGLIGTLAFVNNLFNLEGAQGAVSVVISAPEQPYYKVIGPTFTSAWHAWLGLAIIMTGELATGILGFVGAGRMIAARPESEGEFERSKAFAIAGGMLGALVWYGMFITVGELYFNMWQSAGGLGSAEGAFRYGTVCAVMAFLIAMRED